MTYAYTTQKQVRAAFWAQDGSKLYGCPAAWKTQNDYPVGTRMHFVDFVDALARDGQISEALAQRVTL